MKHLLAVRGWARVGTALAVSVLALALALAGGPAGAAEPANSTPAAGPATSQVGPEYVIGPGDTIQVFVWRSPELSVIVPVRPDGKISTPLVEDVVATGKTPSELARDMEKVLSAYVRSPQVNIIVTNALGAYSHVTVIGQVAKPQTVPYKEGMTLMDVVLTVGGLTDFAAGNRAKLVRKGQDGKDVTIKVHLQDLLRKGAMSENIAMRPGDVLIVPESLF